MEVHHHAHTARKRWTHYFWEFLMLFLAVTLGFFVENQREHIIENNREKKYMQSLYSDLKLDTAHFNNFSAYLSRIYKRLDSVQMMVNSRQYITAPDQFYRLASGTRSIRYFESYNSAYEQLKNSGNLRLIRKQRLADSIVNYYSIIQERVSAQELRYVQATANIAAAMWDILDSRFFNRDTSIERMISGFQMAENAKTEIINEEKLLKYKNLCYEKMLLLPSLRNFIRELNMKATNILMLLKEEYHLK